MSDRPPKHGFAARLRDAESWIKASAEPDDKPVEFTARLTIDITPELRGRIKIAAFRRGATVADMLRDLLVREFPETAGDRP